jgi:O-antigen/teichoic acid export membrane protein
MRHGATAEKAVQNVLFSGFRLIIGAGATICTSAIMARTLGPTNMGVFGYAMWIVGTMGAFANIGLPVALTKYISEYVGRGEKATAALIGKKLLKAQMIVAAAAAALTASFLLFGSPYRSIIGLAAVMLFVQAVQQSLSSALVGIERFDRIALISVSVALAQVAAVGAAALLHAGVVGMLWGTLAGLAVGTALSYRELDTLLLKSDLPPLAFPAVPEMTAIYSRIKAFLPTMSYILLLDTIVWQRSEVLFLKWYSSLSQIAFYTLAYSMAAKLNDISSTFSSILLPLYSANHGNSNRTHEVGAIYSHALKYLQIIMVFPCLVAAIICKSLVYLIYGPNYTGLILPLQILVVSVAFTSIGTVGSPLLVGTEKQSFIAKYGSVVAVLNVALDFILIPRYGAIGAAVANCAAQIIGVLGGTLYTVRYARARFPWRSTATIYASAGVALLPIVYCPSGDAMTLAGSIAIGGILYVGLLAIAGELGKADLNTLRASFSARLGPRKPLESTELV